MFVLRKISGAGVQMNFALGKSYTLIHKERNPEEFQNHLDHDEYARGLGDRLYAIVCGDSIHHLVHNQKNFIMNSRGDTFDNLTEPKSVPPKD